MRITLLCCHFCLIFALIFNATALRAQQWTRFRGPNGAGVAPASALPPTWTDADYAWRVELAGSGPSSPVVFDDSVYVTSAKDSDALRYVQCLRTDNGKVVWEKSFPSQTFKKNRLNSYAVATPPVDKDRLYVSWISPESYLVVALDRKTGDEIWRRDLGPFKSMHGPGPSSILYDGSLIVPNDQDGTSFVVALDCLTGKDRWKVDRTTEARSKSEKKAGIACYSTPCILQLEGAPPQLILNSWGQGMTSLNPTNGSKYWQLPIFTNRIVGSPEIAAGVIVGSAGEGGGGTQCVAVTPGNPAKGTEPKLAYELSGSLPYVPTPVANGNLLFLLSDSGVMTCCDAPTGKVIWRERLGGKYFASPIRVGDRIYCVSNEGEMTVLTAGDKFDVLGRTKLGEGTNATPAVENGVMYIRTFSHLMALRPK